MTDRAQARDDMTELVEQAWPGDADALLFDDRPGSPPADETTSWGRVSVRHNSGGQATLANHNGERRWRREGILTVQVFTPSGDGLSENDVYSKALENAMDGALTPNGVELHNTRAVEVGPDGAWFQTNVISEFLYDEVR